MTNPEDDLVRRAGSGDAIAVDTLLSRFLPGLRAFVRLRTGPVLRSKESSGDLVQSVCREVIEQADRFQHGGDVGFKQWLYRTAVRKIADRHEYYNAAKRDVKREQSPALRAAQSDDQLLQCYQSFYSPSQHAAAREELERVERAFDRLPEHYREVILQARLMGLSSGEIGARTGRTEGAVRTLLSRAVARLAELLDDDA